MKETQSSWERDKDQENNSDPLEFWTDWFYTYLELSEITCMHLAVPGKKRIYLLKWQFLFNKNRPFLFFGKNEKRKQFLFSFVSVSVFQLLFLLFLFQPKQKWCQPLFGSSDHICILTKMQVSHNINSKVKGTFTKKKCTKEYSSVVPKNLPHILHKVNKASRR